MNIAPSETTINLRAPARKRELIDKAATLAGKSRTAFMLDASCEKAYEVLADQTRFVLSDKKSRAFNALLDAPLAKNKAAIARLLAKRSPWER
jgi:uncharacterized protein (DUF1778 family)